MDVYAHEELGMLVLQSLADCTTWPVSMVDAKRHYCGTDVPISDFHRGIGYATSVGWLDYTPDLLALKRTPLGETALQLARLRKRTA